MTTKRSSYIEGIDRRTVLKSVGVASGASLVGTSAFTGLVGAKGTGKGAADERSSGPCHKDFECAEAGTYVKFEFVIEEAEDGEVTSCGFEEETETGLFTVAVEEHKDGETCEPIAVSWQLPEGWAVGSLMAYGGTDCQVVDSAEGTYVSELETKSGQQAAISNLQFCIVERALPECPFYGTSREDPTAIWSIRTDPDTGDVVEEKVKDITADLGDSNYPNGLAFDAENEVWYFAEKGGVLNTMNEDGCLGITTYESVSNGKDIAGAAFYDGGYYFTPQNGDTLYRVEISGGTVSRTTVCANLPLGNKTFGDIAIDENGIAYFSVSGAFFWVDLADCSNHEVVVQSTDRTAYAVLSQIAFANGTLWAHHAGTGDWRTVDVETGELSDLVDTTRQYTDIAQCGFYELTCQ